MIPLKVLRLMYRRKRTSVRPCPSCCDGTPLLVLTPMPVVAVVVVVVAFGALVALLISS